jgi:hypothetical protein
VNSLKKLDYPNFNIIVVENGSIDDSANILSRIEGISLIYNQENLGFTGGNNIAIRAALTKGARYVWLVNSDVIVAPDCLSKMIDAAEGDPQIGLLSPVIYFTKEPNTPQYCSGFIEYPYYNTLESPDLPTAQRLQAENPERVILWGTALLIRRETIERIGFLDDLFFAYFEDIDYSVRSINAGFKNMTVFCASIWHDNPMEFGQMKPHFYYYNTRNSIFFVRKQIGHTTTRLRVFYWIFLRSLRLSKELHRTPLSADAVLAGLWDGWRGISGSYNATRRMPSTLRWAVLLFNGILAPSK